jgi:hypothetical protein
MGTADRQIDDLPGSCGSNDALFMFSQLTVCDHARLPVHPVASVTRRERS